MKVKLLSHVRLFATPWTVAYQAPPSMGFSRQEYWSRLPFPSPGDLPNPGIEPRSPALLADALTSEPLGLYTRSPALLADALTSEPQLFTLGSPRVVTSNNSLIEDSKTATADLSLFLGGNSPPGFLRLYFISSHSFLYALV